MQSCGWVTRLSGLQVEQSLDHLLVDGLIELVHGLGAEVATADCPLVVLLLEDGTGEAKQSSSVGEDADYLTTPADLAVQPLQPVGRPDLPAVLDLEAVAGQEAGRA